MILPEACYGKHRSFLRSLRPGDPQLVWRRFGGCNRLRTDPAVRALIVRPPAVRHPSGPPRHSCRPDVMILSHREDPCMAFRVTLIASLVISVSAWAAAPAPAAGTND